MLNRSSTSKEVSPRELYHAATPAGRFRGTLLESKEGRNWLWNKTARLVNIVLAKPPARTMRLAEIEKRLRELGV